MLCTAADAKIHPTTRPSAEEIQAVKAALHRYNALMFAGDLKGMLAAQKATTDNAKKLAKASAESDVAVGKLEMAVEKKFGKEPRNWVAAIVEDATDDVAEGADVRVEGDKALVLFKSGGSAPIVRVGKTWVIDADTQAAMTENVSRFIDTLKKRQQVAEETAKEVEAGKYKTMPELVGAVKKRMPEGN